MAESKLREHVLEVDPDPRKLGRIIRRFNVVSVILVVLETDQRVGGLAAGYNARKLDIPPVVLKRGDKNVPH